jgi:hypothetical protein
MVKRIMALTLLGRIVTVPNVDSREPFDIAARTGSTAMRGRAIVLEAGLIRHLLLLWATCRGSIGVDHVAFTKEAA